MMATPVPPSTSKSPPSPAKSKAPDNPKKPKSPTDTETGKHIRVNLATQQAEVKDGNTVVKTMRVATGRQGFRTKTGQFVIVKNEKNKNHRSSTYGVYIMPDGKRIPANTTKTKKPKGARYEGAPMNYYLQFSGNPFGFHDGSLSQRSHGCIHLSAEDAEWLWNWAKSGTKTFIFGKDADGTTAKKK